MSGERFEWLEFGEAAPSTAPAGTRDERQLMLDAARAFAEGEYEPALRAWSSALKADKALHDAWAGQVRSLVRLKELRESQAWAAKACQLFPGVALLESARAYALASSGLLSQALEASDGALEIAERTGLQEPRLWLERAACLLADGQKSTAALCLQKSRELRPDDPDWEQEIAVELMACGDLAEALACLDVVTARRADRPYAWLLTAQVARRLGKRKQALEAVEHCERLRPGYPPLADERRLLRGRPCWIATLVFGHELHPTVIALRDWRNERWMGSAWGRAAASLYDCTAPAVCCVLVHLPCVRHLLRRGLSDVARRVGGPMAEAPRSQPRDPRYPR